MVDEQEKKLITTEQKDAIKFIVAKSMVAGRRKEVTKSGAKLYFPQITVMKKYKRYSKLHVFTTARETEAYSNRWLSKYISMLKCSLKVKEDE